MRTKLITVMAFAVLLTGVITYSRSDGWSSRAKPQLRTGHTIEFRITQNGKVFATSVRYTKSNGEFLEDTNYLNPDGSSASHAKLAGTIDRGAVVVDDVNQKLKQAGRAVLLHDTTEAEIRAIGFVDREESLLGYKVLVQRRCVDQNQECAEFWLAPDLGGAPLKFDIISPDGGRKTQEATRITLGEPSFVVPNYPLDTSILDKMQQMRPEGRRQRPQ